MGRKCLLLSLITLMFLALPTSVLAGWTRTYGEAGEKVDVGRCMDYTTDSGYIIVGRTTSFGASVDDIWLLKIDSTGDTLWTKTYGGQYSDYGYCVATTPDGGFIILGGPYSVWLLKTDEKGDTLWTRTYDQGQGDFVQPTSDGGYIITGSICVEDEPVQNLSDIWLIKTDSLGNIEWDVTYGGEDCDWGSCVRETDDGGYVIAGTKDAFQGLWGAQAFWMKVDSTGEELWEHSIGKGIDYAYEGLCIQETSDRGFIISGYITAVVSADFGDFLVKTDSGGVPEWGKEYSISDVSGSQCVQETPDGDYIVTGSDLFKADGEDGEVLWQRNYGGFGNWVLCTSDDGYLVVGAKDQDLWLLKTDAQGDTLDFIQESPVTQSRELEIITDIGPQIVLRYENLPQGFHASVFDASGHKVDGVHSYAASGRITWGEEHPSGVYFIKSDRAAGSTRKVILIN